MRPSFTFIFIIPQPYKLAGEYLATANFDRHGALDGWSLTFVNGDQIPDSDFDSVADACRPHVYNKATEFEAAFAHVVKALQSCEASVIDK